MYLPPSFIGISKSKFHIVLNKYVSNDTRITLNYLQKSGGKLF